MASSQYQHPAYLHFLPICGNQCFNVLCLVWNSITYNQLFNIFFQTVMVVD